MPLKRYTSFLVPVFDVALNLFRTIQWVVNIFPKTKTYTFRNAQYGVYAAPIYQSDANTSLKGISLSSRSIESDHEFDCSGHSPIPLEDRPIR